MSWQSWAWLAWTAMFAVVEGIALAQKDRPGEPRTLSANTRWLIQGAGAWHHVARAALVLFLAWLTPHLLVA